MAKPKPPLYCSFCRRSSDDVDKLVGGPGVFICDVCVGLCVTVLDAADGKPTKGDPSPPFGGWGSLDDDTLLKSLVPAGSCLQSLDASIREQVGALRDRGVTWQLIADQLGVTRQAVQQRFRS
jgi:ATP-dependent Clp protease ATP-binding subunit ClpX